MPSLESIVRGAYEECSNNLDANPDYRLMTEAVQTPQGEFTITCKRTRTGDVSITIHKTKVVSEK
jgi:hypothetical protein